MPLTFGPWFHNCCARIAIVSGACSAAASCCCSIGWLNKFLYSRWALRQRHSFRNNPAFQFTGWLAYIVAALFWFFGHPEVYIAICPAWSERHTIFLPFARKPVFGYRAMVFAIFAIGALGFFVWGHTCH